MNANTVSLFTYPRAVLGERLLAQRELEDRKAERERQQQQNKKRKRKKNLPLAIAFTAYFNVEGGSVAEFVFFTTYNHNNGMQKIKINNEIDFFFKKKISSKAYIIDRLCNTAVLNIDWELIVDHQTKCHWYHSTFHLRVTFSLFFFQR
jgi:hypothetical protein